MERNEKGMKMKLIPQFPNLFYFVFLLQVNNTVVVRDNGEAENIFRRKTDI